MIVPKKPLWGGNNKKCMYVCMYVRMYVIYNPLTTSSLLE